MRHRKSGKKFGRDTKARAALLRALALNLVRDGKIVTTKARASELGRVADRLLTIARKGDVAARRQLQAFFGTREAANTLVDRYAPALKDRLSGVTRTEVIGPRAGDNTMMVSIGWVVDVAKGLKNPDPKKPEAKKTLKKAETKTVVKTEKKAETKETTKKAPAKKVAAVKTAK